MPPITLDWLHIVVLLGAIQGFVLAGALATQRRNRTANRLLAVLMLTFSTHLLSVAYYAAGLVRAFPHFFGVGYPLPFLYGPLVFLYAVTAGDRTRRLTRWDALHFLPFAAVVIAGLPIYLAGGAEKVALYHQFQEGGLPPLLSALDPLKFVSGLSYAAATIVFLRRHHARIKDSYSSLERVNLEWLAYLAAAAAAIWMLATFLSVASSLNASLFARQDDVVALAIAVFVYAVGYMGLRQPEVFNYVTAEHRIPAIAAPTAGEPGATESPAPGKAEPRYERSGLTDSQATVLESALLGLMDTEAPYRNSDLTLADLANRLGTTPHRLSEVLNSQLEQTFYDFVNGYRIRDVQARMTDDRFRNLTILSLALDAGFASKSTFNHVFKKHTGQTPSAFRSSQGTG